MKKNPLISICIPNYNRPDELRRLLKSIDISGADELEIIICDDGSPEREKVEETVGKFKKESRYSVVFKENEKNLGFDKNLKELVKTAKGEWILFMGNDDEFVSGALDKLLGFLRENLRLGYVLRSYYLIHKNGKAERFRYYKGNKFFEPGADSLVQLFRKSVFISGFLIKREPILPLLSDDFDGTLLFQIYLLSEVVLKYPVAYFDEPLTQGYEGGVPFFGRAEAEKSLYTPGTITVDNSINFLKGFIKIAEFIDKKYGLNFSSLIKKDMSKYFYPSLAIQRSKGLKEFFRYVLRLNQMGFNASIYYYIYVTGLVVFGKNICDNAIRILKNILGKTPEL